MVRGPIGKSSVLTPWFTPGRLLVPGASFNEAPRLAIDGFGYISVCQLVLELCLHRKDWKV